MSATPTPVADKQPLWQKRLTSSFLVNWLAISDNGSRVVADTYYFSYPGTTSLDTHGVFGTYCFDSAGNQIWSDVYDGDEGVFSVAISGDGNVVAAGGLY